MTPGMSPTPRAPCVTISTQREDMVKEAPKVNPAKPAALWDAARNKTHMGRLTATGTVAKVVHRMQVLATRKARQISVQKQWA